MSDTDASTGSANTGSEATSSGAAGSGAAGSEAASSEATEKAGGLGHDGTIPPNSDGIAAGIGDESSNFNPEEDPDADTHSDLEAD